MAYPYKTILGDYYKKNEKKYFPYLTTNQDLRVGEEKQEKVRDSYNIA